MNRSWPQARWLGENRASSTRPTGAAAFALAFVAVAIGGSLADAAAVTTVLEPLSRTEIVDADAIGTGCSWALTGDRRTRFAAADDHALIKLGGRLVRLKPGHGARDLFPFTFDAWTAGGTRVSIVKHGTASRHGDEAIVQNATLMLEMDGKVIKANGHLDCGS